MPLSPHPENLEEDDSQEDVERHRLQLDQRIDIKDMVSNHSPTEVGHNKELYNSSQDMDLVSFDYLEKGNDFED